MDDIVPKFYSYKNDLENFITFGWIADDFENGLSDSLKNKIIKYSDGEVEDYYREVTANFYIARLMQRSKIMEQNEIELTKRVTILEQNNDKMLKRIELLEQAIFKLN